MALTQGYRLNGKSVWVVLAAFFLVLWTQGSYAAIPDPASAEGVYQHARKAYYRLINSPKQRSFRSGWLHCIERFAEVEKKFPDTPQSLKAVFTIGRLYHGLFKELKNPEDLEQALVYYQKVVSHYTYKSLADDAVYHQAEIYLEKKKYVEANNAYITILLKYPNGDQVARAQRRMQQIQPLVKKQLASYNLPHSQSPEKQVATKKRIYPKAPLPSTYAYQPKPSKQENNVVLQKVSYSAKPGRSRVTIYTNGPVHVDEDPIPHDGHYSVRFPGTHLNPNLARNIRVGDAILEDLQIREQNRGIPELVLNLSALRPVRIHTSTNDSQIVLELESENPPVAAPEPVEPVKMASRWFPLASFKPGPVQPAGDLGGESPEPVVAVQKTKPENKIPLIVIDPGHGGKDDGAKGRAGTFEKHVNLKVSKLLAEVLKTQYHYRVKLTREDDTFIPVKERGDIANNLEATLFVSVHANAAKRRSAQGIETYYLGNAMSEQAMETAARENGDLVKSVQDDQVQEILASLISTTKINDSARLAGRVQNNMLDDTRKAYPKTRDLGVKEGPFYVLHDTKMPSILVELGFLTNAEEERRLNTETYLNSMAHSIARGIHTFLKQRAPSI